MELQFQESSCDFLRTVTQEVLSQEQTQEVRLPDSMPDIGRILAAWGQPMIRSKEWRSSGMTASGGIMAWVLYAPEDGTPPRSVETWIPFQLRWDFPQTQRDGTMRMDCRLSSVDARSLSARKLMIRAQLSALGEALEPDKASISHPGELPKDIELLQQTYPVVMPKEAGEKTFALDEELELPTDRKDGRKLLYFSLRPELTDQKVMGDKVVFRGSALGHTLLQREDGSVTVWDFEIPFSQYAQLDKEYGPEGSCDVLMALTNLEMELTDSGNLRVKAGLVGQYLVHDRAMITVVLDAYSPKREVKQEITMLRLPALLDHLRNTVTATKVLPSQDDEVTDICFHLGYPQVSREGDRWVADLAGSFQLLTDKPEGQTLHWDTSVDAAAGGDTKVWAGAWPSGMPRVSDGEAKCDVHILMKFMGQTQIPMVSALMVGEEKALDPQRPSLILVRPGDDRLWDIAKANHTTVEAIREANGFLEEAAENSFLLIPIP